MASMSSMGKAQQATACLPHQITCSWTPLGQRETTVSSLTTGSALHVFCKTSEPLHELFTAWDDAAKESLVHSRHQSSCRVLTSLIFLRTVSMNTAW